MNAPPDGRESSDLYRAEICRQGRCRVILCKDGIQWILQRRGKAAGARWRSVSYFTTRAALIKAWAGLCDGVPPELKALPDKVRREAGG